MDRPEPVAPYSAQGLPSQGQPNGQGNFTENRHLGYLDSLRGLAAIFVVLHHSWYQVNRAAIHLSLPLQQALNVFYFGHYAVDLFIVLSGFCLMLSVIKNGGHLKGGSIRFFQRRAWRILPPYYLAMGVSLLLIHLFIGHKTGTQWDYSLPVTKAGVISHLLLVQDAFPNTYSRINHAFWSISVEWRVYFAFPILVIGWQRIGPLYTTFLAVLTAIGLSILTQQPTVNPFCYFVMPQYLGLFAIGMFGADFALGPPTGWRRGRTSPRLPKLTVALLAIVVGLSKAHLWHGQVMPLAVTDYFVGLTAMFLIVLTSADIGGVLYRSLSWRPLVFVGTFAYSIYLVHAPLLQLLWQTLFLPLHPKPLLLFAAYIVVGLPLVLGGSYLFFLACEKPFLRGRQRLSEVLRVTKIEVVETFV